MLFVFLFVLLLLLSLLSLLPCFWLHLLMFVDSLVLVLVVCVDGGVDKESWIC